MKLIICIVIIHIMNLSGFDLNLLMVFNALMAERHVTRAAERIGMSQPALSNALGRLRYHLKDDLFVRSRAGMQPTPRAMELAEPIRAALEQVEGALTAPTFDPVTADRQFVVGLTDYAVITLFPSLMAHLQSEAPGIRLRLIAHGGHTLKMLDDQVIDFGITALTVVPPAYGSVTLVDEGYVLLMRRGNSLMKGRLTLKRYAAARHLLMSPRGDATGFVDANLAEHGLMRTVAVTVSNFSAAPPLIAASDLVMACPKQIAEHYAPLYDLGVRPAPFQGPREFATAILVWHKSYGAHPAHDWLRETLVGFADARS
ncbi:MAG: LysR family transcriptional regulator [Pseudomonadota bacterium]